MKIKTTLLGVLLSANLLSAQSFTTNSYTVTPSNGQIADGNPVGLTEAFSVSGLAGSVADVQLSLNISGGYNGDLYAFLVGPQGQLAVLLNRVGVTGTDSAGYSDAGLNLTLAGSGVNNIHDYQTVPGYSLNGTVWAADGRAVDPQAAGGTLYGTPTTSGLGLFNNSDPNGLWTLFIADLSTGGGTATFNQAVLTIVTVPEPAVWSLLGGGLLCLAVLRNRKTGGQQD